MGDAYDNACAETVMGIYKNEAIAKGSPFRRRPLKNLEDVEEITLSWVQWYSVRIPAFLNRCSGVFEHFLP